MKRIRELSSLALVVSAVMWGCSSSRTAVARESSVPATEAGNHEAPTIDPPASPYPPWTPPTSASRTLRSDEDAYCRDQSGVVGHADPNPRSQTAQLPPGRPNGRPTSRMWTYDRGRRVP